MIIIKLTKEQKNLMAEYFKDLAVAWTVAVFATPTFFPETQPLTVLFYAVNIIIAIALALLLTKENL